VPSFGHWPPGTYPGVVDGTAWIEQPGWVEIRGRRAWVWCGLREVAVRVAADWELTLQDVEDAAAIEPALEGAPLERIEPEWPSMYNVTRPG
jgi:hypothetical protein